MFWWGPQNSQEFEVPKFFSTWRSIVTFFGMAKWPFKWLSDRQIGDHKVTLNHLVCLGLGLKCFLCSPLLVLHPLPTSGSGFTLAARSSCNLSAWAVPPSNNPFYKGIPGIQTNGAQTTNHSCKYAAKILRAFLTSFSAGYEYVYVYVNVYVYVYILYLYLCNCVFSLKVFLQATPIFVVHFFIQKKWKRVRPREKNLRHIHTHAQKHNFFNGLYLPNYEQRDLTSFSRASQVMLEILERFRMLALSSWKPLVS